MQNVTLGGWLFSLSILGVIQFLHILARISRCHYFLLSQFPQVCSDILLCFNMDFPKG